MSCPNCNKYKLANCEDCDFTVDSECVNHDGDTLSDILEDIMTSQECTNRPSKTITGDYTIIDEDTCRILLLDGVVSDTPEDIEYTITLPNTKSFANKLLIIKDISGIADPSGSVNWNFDESIEYDFEQSVSTISFETLSFSLHKVLWLAFIKQGPSYKWTCISPNAIDFTSDIVNLQEQISILQADVTILQVQTTTEYTEYEDVDLQNDWLNQGSSVARAYKKGDEVKLSGLLRDGKNGTIVFTLPSGYEPDRLIQFPSLYNDGGGTQIPTTITITTSGDVYITVDGISINTNITGYVYLSGINYYYYN